eukprot:7057102-Pyramimonas_sp.AAC.1
MDIDTLSELFQHLPPASLARLATCSKTLLEALTYESVLRSVFFHGGPNAQCTISVGHELDHGRTHARTRPTTNIFPIAHLNAAYYRPASLLTNNRR